ncbi:MAG: Ig-like domain-containing protein [Thermoplasmata archaeon]|jgi:hypothetical protein|nr:Ig-like domain-containing protein [Thermoplasmata archaeon]
MTAVLLMPSLTARGATPETVDPVLSVNGPTDYGLAGRSVAIGDIDGDGVAELIVGAPSDGTNGGLSGAVMIYDGGVLDDTPEVTILGSRGEQFGWSVAYAGDLNSDGRGDLVIGAPFNDTAASDAGTAYVFNGASIASIKDRAWNANLRIGGSTAGESFGFAVAAVGDLNSDGYDDIAVGAPLSGAGRVAVYYGGSPMDATADKSFSGATTGDRYGSSIAGGINVDGTVSPDLAVGAPMSSSAKGAVQVILNPAKSTPKYVTLAGSTINGNFGNSLAMLDFDDDSYGDLAVGAPGESAGKVYIYHGSSISGKFDNTADKTFVGEMSNDRFGYSICAGDPRTDLMTDLVVGAPYNDDAYADAGKVYVFFGNSTADTDADEVATGLSIGAQFGFSVASGEHQVADFDGDAAADFIVGAPLNGTTYSGSAHLFLGTEVIVPANPTVFGYVLDESTGIGIYDALVTIQGAGVSTTARTTTNGSYGIATDISVPPGTYWINASHTGYISESESWALIAESRTNVSFSLCALPVVHGTVYDGLTVSDTLEDVAIEVLSGTGSVLAATTTDKDGEYFVRLTVEGEITVRASTPYYFTNTTTFTIAAGDNLTKDLRLEHWPVLEFTATDNGSTPADEPLSGVLVEVEIGGTRVAYGTTNSTGMVTLQVNAQGVAWINASKLGYDSRTFVETLVQNVTTTMVEGFDRLPSVMGTVRNALTGMPISGATVQLLEDGSLELVSSATTSSIGAYAFSNVGIGVYAVRVTATSYIWQTHTGITVTANSAEVEDFSLIPDTVAPVSSISDPAPGTVVTDVEFDVLADANDPNANGISRVDLYYNFDGGQFSWWGMDTEAPYSFTFNASDARGDGYYAFFTLATDYAGNREAVPSANDTWILMDAGLPVSSVSALDETTTDSEIMVTASADDEWVILWVELWYSYEGGAYENYSADFAHPYIWDFVAADGDGLYSFYSIAVNELGQRELAPAAPDTETILDTTSPDIQVTAPEEGALVGDSAVGLTGTVWDNQTGLKSVSYSVDGGGAVALTVTEGAAELAVSVTLDLEDGLHTVTVYAVDMVDWSSESDVSFTVDSTAPVITMTAPEDGSYIASTDVTVTWTVEDVTSSVSSVSTKLDDEGWVDATGDSVSYASLDEGAHTVQVRAVDEATNVATESVGFVVDTYEPTVHITAPADGATVLTSDVDIVWQASDIGSEIDYQEVSVDGGAWYEVASSPETLTLDDGDHTVDVRAFDMAGNSDQDTVSFTVDATAPMVTITSPEDGACIDTDTLVISWTVSETGPEVTVEYRVDGGSWQAVTEDSVTLSGLDEGEHTVDVMASDDAGNDYTDSVTFTVDMTDPSVSITSPDDGAEVGTEDIDVTWTATDLGCGISTVEVRVDGGIWLDAGTSPTTVYGLSDGSHTIEVMATDSAGNWAMDSVGIVVDATGPTVVITEPDEGATLPSSTVDVAWTADDGTGVGVDTVEMQVDGGAWTTVTGGTTALTGLADGEHTVVVMATDLLGNEGSASVTFTVDTVGPSVSIVSPVDGYVSSSASIVFVWEASADSETIQYRVDGGSWVVVTGSSVTLSSIADGSHTFEVSVEDDAGQTSSDTIDFVVDTTAPVIEISAPVSGDEISSTSVAVEWTATDVTSGLDAVEMQVDDGVWTVVTDGTEALAGLAEGLHTVAIRATDVAGNEATEEVTFRVDVTDPTVSITSPDDGELTSSDSVDVTYVATDLGSGVETVQYSVDGGALTTVTGGSFELTALEDGAHTVEVTVTDGAGNAASASIEVVVDTTTPTVTVTSPESGSLFAEDMVTMEWTASDSGSGIATVEVSIDATSWTTATGGTFEFTGLDDGSIDLYVRVTDMAGNAAQVYVSVTVDTTAPELSIASPDDGDSFETAEVTVSWEVSDAVSGIDRCEVSIDDGSFVDVGDDTERLFEDLESGEHTVTVRAYDAAGNMEEVEVTFTVDIKSETNLMPYIIGGVLVVVVLAGIAVYMMRRKK